MRGAGESKNLASDLRQDGTELFGTPCDIRRHFNVMIDKKRDLGRAKGLLVA